MVLYGERPGKEALSASYIVVLADLGTSRWLGDEFLAIEV